jgi:hypothetical protein
MRTALCIAVVLCVVGTLYQEASAASVKRTHRLPKRVVTNPIKDAASDAVVDTALAEVAAQIVAEGFDPTDLSQTILGVTITGNVTGFSNIARISESSYTTQGPNTYLDFEFAVFDIIVQATFTIPDVPDFQGQGIAEIQLESVTVSAEQQNDGSYLLDQYQAQPLTIDLVLWNLGDYEIYEETLRALIEELIQEEADGIIDVLIEEYIVLALNDDLATSSTTTVISTAAP